MVTMVTGPEWLLSCCTKVNLLMSQRMHVLSCRERMSRAFYVQHNLLKGKKINGPWGLVN